MCTCPSGLGIVWSRTSGSQPDDPGSNPGDRTKKSQFAVALSYEVKASGWFLHWSFAKNTMLEAPSIKEDNSKRLEGRNGRTKSATVE
jgi:hypothetical protein